MVSYIIYVAVATQCLGNSAAEASVVSTLGVYSSTFMDLPPRHHSSGGIGMPSERAQAVIPLPLDLLVLLSCRHAQPAPFVATLVGTPEALELGPKEAIPTSGILKREAI